MLLDPTQADPDYSTCFKVTTTCHRRQLQQRLCGHFDRYAALQIGLVTLEGDLAALGLHGSHSVLRGLQGGLHRNALARGVVLVRVAASTMLGPGTVQQLITLRRFWDVAAGQARR